MRTTFYIHIGVHKTGTKSIQHTFADNRDVLLAHGINYLPGDPNHGPTLISLLSDYPHYDTRNIRRHVDTPEKAASYNAAARYEIDKALARNRSPKMVISGEGLSGLSETEMLRLKEMLGPYAAAYRIIVYVRDPYEYSNSASLQRLKSGSLLGVSDRKLPLPNYRRRLDRYIKIFGRENIDIRVFNPKRFIGGELVTDFLVAIGESPDLAKELNIVRSNQSMSHEAAMILSETNKVIPNSVDGRANRARAFGFHTYIVDIEGEKFVIDPTEFLKHESEVQDDIAWLNQVLGEAAFGSSRPRPASTPRWGEATIRSIKNVLSQMTSELDKLESKRRLSHPPRPPLPAGLEWLAEAYGTPPTSPAVVPEFDPARVQALGCFLHAIVLHIQHLQAEEAAHKGRFLLWISPRKSENHFREVVRLNPARAITQYRLSQALLLRGYFVEARKAAEAAAQLEPGKPRFARWLRVVDLAGRWIFRQAPEPAEPATRKPRHLRRHALPDRANRPARAKADRAASRRPPQ